MKNKNSPFVFRSIINLLRMVRADGVASTTSKMPKRIKSSNVGEMPSQSLVAKSARIESSSISILDVYENVNQKLVRPIESLNNIHLKYVDVFCEKQNKKIKGYFLLCNKRKLFARNVPSSNKNGSLVVRYLLLQAFASSGIYWRVFFGSPFQLESSALQQTQFEQSE